MFNYCDKVKLKNSEMSSNFIFEIIGEDLTGNEYECYNPHTKNKYYWFKGTELEKVLY